MRKGFNTIKRRWKARTPIFFRRVIAFSTGVAGLTAAVQGALIMANANIPEWWSEIYPYTIAFPAGMAFLGKFTEVHKEPEHDTTGIR